MLIEAQHRGLEASAAESGEQQICSFAGLSRTSVGFNGVYVYLVTSITAPCSAPVTRSADRPLLLVMPVIFLDISTSRCGNPTVKLESPKCPCPCRV